MLVATSFKTAWEKLELSYEKNEKIETVHEYPPQELTSTAPRSDGPAASALAPMLSKLAKHVAVISGGGSGLGRATAEHLVKSGARVVLLDLPSSDGAVVAELLGENATFCPTDVTSEEQVSAALDLAESLYGEPVSSAISCAGILHAAKTVSRKGVAYPLDAFSRVLHVNVVGTFNVSRLAAQRMVARSPDEDG